MFPATLTSAKKPSGITSNDIINQLPGQVSCDETALPEIMHHRGAFDYLNPILPPQILPTVHRFPKITPDQSFVLPKFKQPLEIIKTNIP